MNLFINDTPFFLLRDLDEADPLLKKRIHRGDEIYELEGLSGTVVITDVSTKQALSLGRRTNRRRRGIG